MDGVEAFVRERIGAHAFDIVSYASEELGIDPSFVRDVLARLSRDGTLESYSDGNRSGWRWRPTIEAHVGPSNPRLNEDRVWADHVEPMLHAASDNVRSLFQHCTTEMVNNVIDHAQATRIAVFVKELADEFEVQIEDDGIGIFRKLMNARPELTTPSEVALELAKGKLTTAPEAHTGQGVFFSSRMCDKFLIWSDTTVCGHFEGGTWHVQKEASRPGTTVRMAIRKDTKRTTKDVFDDFALPEPDGFVRTGFQAALIANGSKELVSRSQAKRLLARCERFLEVELDFAGIDSISPAFADEVFRVFTTRNPRTAVRWINANDHVRSMIERAQASGRSGESR